MCVLRGFDQPTGARREVFVGCGQGLPGGPAEYDTDGIDHDQLSIIGTDLHPKLESYSRFCRTPAIQRTQHALLDLQVASCKCNQLVQLLCKHTCAVQLTLSGFKSTFRSKSFPKRVNGTLPQVRVGNLRQVPDKHPKAWDKDNAPQLPCCRVWPRQWAPATPTLQLKRSLRRPQLADPMPAPWPRQVLSWGFQHQKMREKASNPVLSDPMQALAAAIGEGGGTASAVSQAVAQAYGGKGQAVSAHRLHSSAECHFSGTH